MDCGRAQFIPGTPFPFRHAAHVGAVRVATGKHCHPGGRTHRGGMHVVVAQAALGQALKAGMLTGPPKQPGSPNPKLSIKTKTTLGAPAPLGGFNSKRAGCLRLARVDLGDRGKLRAREAAISNGPEPRRASYSSSRLPHARVERESLRCA